MKSFLSFVFLFAALLSSAFADLVLPQLPSATPITTPFLRGDLSIRFDTRTQRNGDAPKPGVTDKYKLKLNVADSVIFDGTIEARPFVKNTFGANQEGQLTHSIECYVVNPRNTAQTRNIGRLFGTVPVDEQNVYRFEDGNLKIGIFGVGGAQGFESKVKGLALGKPPAKSVGLFTKAKQDIIKLTNNGVTIPVTKYDKMEFQSHVLSAGPVLVYPEVTVNGSMLYDYDREAWNFTGITVSYIVDGRVMADRLSGNVRWVPAVDRAVSGKGEYQFDVRVNEPLSSEATAFSGPATEESFFAVDTKIASLTGTMSYRDTIVNDLVTASNVTIDLKGNQLTKNQVMLLGKLLLMSCIVPLNAE